MPLSTPWDVCWWQGRLVISMMGTHQLWQFHPETQGVEVLAGTSQEGLVDGLGPDACLAQPSSLAVSPDGSTLWVIDAETSALRAVTVAAHRPFTVQVRTVIGGWCSFYLSHRIVHAR